MNAVGAFILLPVMAAVFVRLLLLQCSGSACTGSPATTTTPPPSGGGGIPANSLVLTVGIGSGVPGLTIDVIPSGSAWTVAGPGGSPTLPLTAPTASAINNWQVIFPHPGAWHAASETWNLSVSVAAWVTDASGASNQVRVDGHGVLHWRMNSTAGAGAAIGSPDGATLTCTVTATP
jgi:hypothetical protein